MTLPDGTPPPVRLGRPGPVRLQIHDRAFFRRIATRGKVGFGESYTAGDWDCDDLVGLFELLLRNADGDRRSAIARSGASSTRGRGRTGATASCAHGATSPTTTTSATTSSR